MITLLFLGFFFLRENYRNNMHVFSSLENFFCQANRLFLRPLPSPTYLLERKLLRSSVEKDCFKDNGYSWEEGNVVISIDITNSDTFHSSLNFSFLPFFPSFFSSSLPSSLPCVFFFFTLFEFTKNLMWPQSWVITIGCQLAILQLLKCFFS